MSDNLREHINKNREDFEMFKFDSEGSWSSIKDRLNKKESSGKSIFLKIAASITLLIASIAVIMLNGFNTPTFDSELSETKYYYEQMIDAQMQLVRNHVEDPQVLEDLEALDKAFHELSDDLQDNVHNEEVIAAMIDNYRLKLKILEKILEDIEESDNDENVRGI